MLSRGTFKDDSPKPPPPLFYYIVMTSIACQLTGSALGSRSDFLAGMGLGIILTILCYMPILMYLFWRTEFRGKLNVIWLLLLCVVASGVSLGLYFL